MKDENWEKIKDIFQAALERPPVERERFLSDACRSDVQLLSEIRQLLNAFEEDEGFMEGAAIAEVAETIAGKKETLPGGKQIARYRIVEKIGAGGMGEVYLAKDIELERLAALKILPAEYSKNEDRLQRFIREAKAVSSLNHPNIITIYEIGSFERSRFIATEFIKGETLRERQRREPLGLREILEIAAQAAAALNAAHSAGIIHRDVKPENIMLREDGFVKVLDFGLAKLTETAEPDNDPDAVTQKLTLTHAGMIIGTASYMSPEQMRGLALVDNRADIWSLGVCLYEMLAGFQPFKGETMSDTVAAVLKSEPPPLDESVPAELHRIVRKALQKNPDERYQTVKDLLLDLKNLKKELEVAEEIGRSYNSLSESRKFFAAADSGVRNSSKFDSTSSASGVSEAETSAAAHTFAAKTGNRKFMLATIVILIVAILAGGSYYMIYDPQPINSVAVLPFQNVGGDENLEYLSDGLSESLIDRLAQLPQLKVITRRSSFRYKNKDVELRDIARALGVRAIITGRVVQRGDDLTVRVEMVDALENKQLWGEQFNRKAENALAVQEEIAQSVLESLRLRLSGVEEQKFAKRETTNPQAYELMLKGRFYRMKGGVENTKRAVEFFNQAIAADSNYALAYAELAVVYRNLLVGGVLNPNEFGPVAEEAARTAIRLDENLAEAHFALANLKTNAWEWNEAERSYKRAIELNPNLAHAHFWYSRFLSCTKQYDASIVAIKRARELDPLAPDLNANVGFAYAFARRYDEAIAELKKALELDPNYSGTYTHLGYSYAAKGLYREAIAAYEQSIRLGDSTPSNKIYLATAYAKAGETEKALAIRKELESGKEYVSPGEIAVLYGALNDKEAAFASLEKAYNEHDLQLQFLNADVAFDSLRDDPRFKALVRRVGLPE